MDGTRSVEFGVVEVEFSHQYAEAYKKFKVANLQRQARDAALAGVIKKFADKLDRVAVQLLKDGPLKMVYKIQENLFFGGENVFGTNHSCFLELSKSQSNAGQIAVVHPFPSSKLTPQWVQQILLGISAKVKAGDGKIILLENFYYFTWKVAIGREELFCDSVIQAKNFDEAKSEMLEKMPSNRTIYDFRVFYDNQWYKLELTE